MVSHGQGRGVDGGAEFFKAQGGGRLAALLDRNEGAHEHAKSLVATQQAESTSMDSLTWQSNPLASVENEETVVFKVGKKLRYNANEIGATTRSGWRPGSLLFEPADTGLVTATLFLLPSASS